VSYIKTVCGSRGGVKGRLVYFSIRIKIAQSKGDLSEIRIQSKLGCLKHSRIIEKLKRRTTNQAAGLNATGKKRPCGSRAGLTKSRSRFGHRTYDISGNRYSCSVKGTYPV